MQEPSYPTNNTKLPENTLKKLTELPCGGKITLEWLQNQIWSETTDFQIPESEVICGMQANIYKIILTNGKNESIPLIAKRVVPEELPPKASLEVWQDFLDSVKREVEFYNAKSQVIPKIFPNVYYSHGFNHPNDLMKSFYLIIMKDVSENYMQNTSMNEVQACDLMKILAKFHAAFWNLDHSNMSRGTFWVLERRNPLKEVEKAHETWNAILDRFPDFDDLVPNIRNLGQQLASKAQILDDFIAANLLTQVHGDCKGWNLFFSKKSQAESSVLLIDMQWTGLGHPLQDVVYALTTTLEPELLDKMDQFLNVYMDQLQNELKIDVSYLKDHFDKVWLDYARVILTGLWKRFSPENIKKHQNTVGPSMIGRSLPHAKFIIRRIHDLLNVQKII